MGWQNVSFLTDASHAEPLCDALMEAGALSASIEDADAGTPDEQPQFGEPGSVNSPGWQHSRVVALMEPDADAAALLAEAAAAIGLAEVPSFSIEEVAEQNWVQLTQSQFDPIRVSERLWIVPSWHESPDPAAINLILDPGMAFGTGSHPTTRLCLEWLERNVSAGCSLLDYGCGSGILAIAAVLHGAGQVDAVDIDPAAVDSTRANALANGVTLTAALPDAAQGAYGLVYANILATPLKLLAPVLSAHVASGGDLVLAGILERQADELKAAYAPWLALEVRDSEEGWILMTARRAA